MAKRLFNKKADMSARKMVFYMVFSFVAVVVFFLIFWMFSSNKSQIAEIPSGFENFFLMQRFTNSPICFTLKEESGRVYPWVIDAKKFDLSNLNRCYDTYNTNTKAFRLTLTYKNVKTTVSTRNWEGILNKGVTRKVIVYQDGALEKGELFIEVQDAK